MSNNIIDLSDVNCYFFDSSTYHINRYVDYLFCIVWFKALQCIGMRSYSIEYFILFLKFFLLMLYSTSAEGL